MKRTSRASTVVLATAAVLAVAVPAYAAWQITATNPTANAKATAIGPVTGVGSSVTSSSVTLTWVAPAGVPATGYTVTRTAPSSATVCTNVAALTCTDSGLSGSTPYSYSVVALRSSWTSSAVSASATTTSASITRTFSLSVTGNATAGSPKSITVTALNDGVTDTTYTGSHTLSFAGASNGPNGNAPTASQAVTFANGVGTANVTLYKAEAFTLNVSEASPARSGSTSVTVVPALPKLSFDACVDDEKTVVKNSSFTTTVTRTGTDPYGNATGTPAVTVNLSPADGNPSNHDFTTATLSFLAEGLTTTASATYDTANGNGTNTITASATGHADATCAVTTTN